MGNRHGHPVIFDRAVFDELRAADPAAGAKEVVRARCGDIVNVPVEDEGAFVDLDTPEDYERVRDSLRSWDSLRS
jgi:molybdenum cofactor cytidylyltransferase